MPLFLSDEELSRYSGDASAVAEKADIFIRDLLLQLETAKAKSDASSITAEQTCSLLEQKYLSLSTDYSNLQSEKVSLTSTLEERLSDLAAVQAEKHQIHLQSISKDGEIERLSVEVSEQHKSRRQLLDLLEQKDLEIGEKNSLIKSYLDKIVNLSDDIALKEAKMRDSVAESARSHSTCARLVQEKELIGKHNVWLNEELTAKVTSLIELRRMHTEHESDMSAKLVNVERQLNECSSSLNWYKDRVRELERQLTSVQEELCSCKETAAGNEDRFSAELATASKLADLYKESAEEWSRKAGDLEGVIKALEKHLSQVENDYREKLEKEMSARKDVEKEADEMKMKLEKCEDELENSRKANEMSILPLSSYNRNSSSGEGFDGDNEIVPQNEQYILAMPKVPTGISGTALAMCLLRDGWSLAKMYEKYQEAVDALRHEKLGRKQLETILQRVLHEIEEKAEFIMDERAEHERMVEAYKLMDEKLQLSHSEHVKLENTIRDLKADLKRQKRDYDIAQKEIVDLQKQVAILLKECRDIQLRCGGDNQLDAEDPLITDALETNGGSQTDKIISERLVSIKDIHGLVEQNVQLRSLVRRLSDQNEHRDAELREKFDDELLKQNIEATEKVEAVLKRSVEQAHMIEALHNSVAMYKRLYEEELKSHSVNSLSSAVVPEDGKKDLLLLFEGSQEVTRKAHEQAVERVRILEEELANVRSEAASLRLDRDRFVMEANFARERLDAFIKESEHQREETNGILARNVEFSQLIVDYQKKLRDGADSQLSSEELSRKLSMEVSILKHEKDILTNSEKRALDEVRSLSERVLRLQASLETIQSAEEVREEARAVERRKQEDHMRQMEREWAEAKKELQEERDRVRTLTLGKEQTLKDAMRQVEELGKQLADALRALSAAEARAAAAEARCSSMEVNAKLLERKNVEINSGPDHSTLSAVEAVVELQKAKEEKERLKEEAQVNKDHMLQYKEIALVNETALKQIEAAHEKFKADADKLRSSLEAEVDSLRERISDLERDVLSKSSETLSALTEKEEALSSAFAEINNLKVDNSLKSSQLLEVEIRISSFKEDLEKEHQRWRVAQNNYERQVILQSETIQELTKTSQALAAMQNENSELRKLADALKSENDVLKVTWEMEKAVFEKGKDEAEKKYHEINEQNKILHSHLEALHIKLAEKVRGSEISMGSSIQDVQGDDDLQTVISYLRRSKEIAETEISLLRQEKLRLKSQLESALRASDAAQSLLHADRSKSRTNLFTDEEFKALKLQVNELNLLRESNMQLREENKHNFEEWQKLSETVQKAKAEADHLSSLLKEKEVELEALRKEIEIQNMEKNNLENKISELLERSKGVDMEDYERLKEDCQNMQLKLREKEAQVEEFSKLVLEKEEIIEKLRLDLENRQSLHNELNIALHEQAAVKVDSEKQKRIISTFKKKADVLAKEKEDLVKDKEVLSKKLEDMAFVKQELSKQIEDLIREKQSLCTQVEDFQSGKKTGGDTPGEQAWKEKDTRIQMLEKMLEREKARRVKMEHTILVTIAKIKQDKDRVQEELEKHKKARDSLLQASGALATQLSSDATLNELAGAYFMSVSRLEDAPQSPFNDAIASHPAPSDISLDDTSSEPAGNQVIPNPAVQSPLTSVAAGSLQAKLLEGREKRLPMPKSTSETRKSGRRLVRPQLERIQEPTSEIEMAEPEGLPNVEDATVTDEMKPGPSHDPEFQGDPSSMLNASSARKRLASSFASEFQEETLAQEAASDTGPYAKRTKGLHALPGAAPEEQEVLHMSEVTGKPVIPEDVGDVGDAILPIQEETVVSITKDGVIGDSAALTEETKESVERINRGDLHIESTSVEEELEKPLQVEEMLDGDLRDPEVLDPVSITEVENEREEGELVSEGLEQQDGSDNLSNLGDEGGDTLVEPFIEDDVSAALPAEVVSSEKNEGGDAIEDISASDKTSGDRSDDANKGFAMQSLQTSPVSFGGGEGSSSHVSKQVSPGRSPVKEAEEKDVVPAGRIVNLGERARENAARRRAAALASAPTRGRGRAVPPTKQVVRGRGRAGRGQSSRDKEKD